MRRGSCSVKVDSNYCNRGVHTILATSALSNAQCFQRGNDLSGVLSRVDLLFNVLDLSVFANVERPTFRNGSFVVYDPIAFGDTFLGVAQDRIIEPEFLGVSCVGFERVTAGREKCHVELVQPRTFCGGDLQFASAE